jgi:hypothetical protein
VGDMVFALFSLFMDIALFPTILWQVSLDGFGTLLKD